MFVQRRRHIRDKERVVIQNREGRRERQALDVQWRLGPVEAAIGRAEEPQPRAGDVYVAVRRTSDVAAGTAPTTLDPIFLRFADR